MTWTHDGFSFEELDDADDADIQAAIAELIDQITLIPRNAQTGTSYTLVLTDTKKLVSMDNASPTTLTVPKNSSVAFPTAPATRIPILNLGAGLLTITPVDGDVTILGNSLTLATNEIGTLLKLATNTWLFLKGAGSPKAVVSGSTGSPATGTYTSGGVTYDYWDFTASGSIDNEQEGLADILIVGGGGGGGSAAGGGIYAGGGGGGGGVLVLTNVWLPAGTLTVTVGAGGASDTAGEPSALGSYIAPGGDKGGNIYDYAFGHARGGSGGGGASTGTYGRGIAGLGSDGGQCHAGQGAAGGGGGAGAAGSNAASAVAGGAGGNGVSNAFNNSSTTFGGGGGGGGVTTGGAGGTGGGGAGGSGGAGTAGTANRGGGGGGRGGADGVGAAGGSGRVILRVAR